MPRIQLGQSSFAILEKAKAEARKSDWKKRIKKSYKRRARIRRTSIKVIVKPIAAGEKVVATTRSPIFKMIRANYSEAVAVDMESNGFFQALQEYRQIEAMVVRGISDRLDKKEETDATGVREDAASHASAFAFEVLHKFKLK